MYVPLGGRGTIAVTVWIIFAFIGLWHDLLFRWLAWALLNAVFFTLEIAVVMFFSSKRMEWLRRKRYYRHLVGVAGVLDIFMLMTANLAILHGFSYTPIFLQKAFLADGGTPPSYPFHYLTSPPSAPSSVDCNWSAVRGCYGYARD
jgi:hypothetical protein